MGRHGFGNREVVAPSVRSGRLGDFQGDFRQAPISQPVVYQRLADLDFHAPRGCCTHVQYVA